MFRVSFVVGGGKKVRSKYPDKLPKDVAAALKSLSFEEDSGASLHIDCAGSFKYQHNTDTDLKTVHVFPNVEIEGGDDAGEAEYEDEQATTKGTLCIESDLDTFQQTVAVKVQSFGQKKMLLTNLKRVVADVAAIDEKLIAMAALSPSEDKLYNGAAELSEKVEWLKEECEKHVNAGQLTGPEIDSVLSTLAKKQEQVEEQVEASEGKAKKLAKLEAMKVKLTAEELKVSSVKPIKRVVKHAVDIARLKDQANKLNKKIEAKSATVVEMTEYNSTNDKLERLMLEQSDAHWFEDPTLQEKVKVPKAKGKKKAGGGGGGGGGSSSGGSWATVGTTKKKGGGGGAKQAAPKRNGFAGLSFDD